MIVSLYAGLSEFAMPTPAIKQEGEEVSHEGKGSPQSLYESVSAEHLAAKGKPAAQDGDAAVLADKARWAALTADFPPIKIGENFAEANLSDGYRLHDVRLDNLDAMNEILSTSKVKEVAAVPASAASAILPSIELDYSSETSISQRSITGATAEHQSVA